MVFIYDFTEFSFDFERTSVSSTFVSETGFAPWAKHITEKQNNTHKKLIRQRKYFLFIKSF